MSSYSLTGPHRILALTRFVSWPSAGAALAPGCVAASDRWSEVPCSPSSTGLARCSVGSGRLPGGESEPTSKRASRKRQKCFETGRAHRITPATLASFKALRAQARYRTSFLRRDAFCENRLFFKSITTATACLAGRLWEGYRGLAGRTQLTLHQILSPVHGCSEHSTNFRIGSY